MTILWHIPRLLISNTMVFLVRIYQYCLRPLLPPTCRFEPGCSEYMILAVRKYGPVIGSAKGVCRVCRCNPFFRGGIDYP